MKPIAPILAATAFALFAGAAFAADSGDRTSPPSKCSERDANCVIQDGPARNRRGQLVEQPPAKGSDNKSGTGKPGEFTVTPAR